MADLYVHAQDGLDANAGTTSAPKQTLAAVDTFLTANPTGSNVYLAGTFTHETWDLPALTNVLITQWSGQTQALFRNDLNLDGIWTNSTGDEWEFTITVDPPTGVSRVFENWESRKDSKGANLGAMSGLGIISGAGSLVANEFDYDGTDLVTVRIKDGGDPNLLTMTYTPAGDELVDAPTFAGLVTDVTISGIHFWLYGFITDNSEASVVGMGLRFIAGSAGLTIKDCEFRDNGDAHIGFNGTVDYDDITIDNCKWFGGSFQGGAVNVVMNGANMSNLTISNFSILGYPTLDRDGIRPTDVIVGINKEHRCFWLVADDANTLSDVILKDGNVDCYNISSFIRFKNIAAGAAATLETFSSYGIRVQDVIVENARSITQPVGGGASIAFKRCYLDGRFQRDTDKTHDFQFIGDNATRGFLYLESCVFIGDSTGATAGGLIHLVDVGSKVYAINTIFHNISTTVAPSTQSIFQILATANETMKLIQCVLSLVSENGIAVAISTGQIAATNMNFLDCWYFGHDATAMTDFADINTPAEFVSLIDANGIYGDDPQFVGAPTKLYGDLQSLITTKTKKVTGATTLGILKNAYSNRYGPYQALPGSTGSGYAAASHFNLVTPKMI